MTNKELEYCILEYGKDIYSFCRHLTAMTQEADDLYQDTFVKAMELSAGMKADGNPKSYLLSIALRIWKNRKRKFAWRSRIWQEQAKGSEYETAAEYAAADSPEEMLLQKEEFDTINAAVAKLPERQKVVVLLYYMEEMSVEEIAKITKIPAGTVKSRLHTARKTLKKELEDILNEERSG